MLITNNFPFLVHWIAPGRSVDGSVFHRLSASHSFLYFLPARRWKPNKQVSILNQLAPAGVGAVQQNLMHQIRYKGNNFQGRSHVDIKHLNVPRKDLPLLIRVIIPIHLTCRPITVLLLTWYLLLKFVLSIKLFMFFKSNPFIARTEVHTILCCLQRHLCQNLNCVFPVNHDLHIITVLFYIDDFSLESLLFKELLHPSLQHIFTIAQRLDFGF